MVDPMSHGTAMWSTILFCRNLTVVYGLSHYFSTNKFVSMVRFKANWNNCVKVLYIPRVEFFGNMTSVPIWCRWIEYPDGYAISDFWWIIHTIQSCCAAALHILMWGPCKDVFSLTIFQDSMYSARIIKVRGSLPETVGGKCRCLRNVFTSGYILSVQTYVPSRIYSTCGSSHKATILDYT